MDISTPSLQGYGTKNKTAHIILKNAADTNYYAKWAPKESFSGIDPQTRSRLHIVADMADSAVQTLGTGKNYPYDGRDLMISGGITINSGTIKVRFCQAVSDLTNSNNRYVYKNITYKKDDTIGARTYNITYCNGSYVEGTFVEGAATNSTHGNLELNGGKFMTYDTTDVITGAEGTVSTYGAFRFTNIIYKDGIISLRLKDANNIESLDLTTYYQKEQTTDTDALVFYTAEGGGTVRFASDAKEGTKIKFDFGASDKLGWLIDYEADGKKA